MALDIHYSIRDTNNEDIDDFSDGENFYKHSLSRTFCNLMLRRHTLRHEYELNQISKITKIDITPLHEMDDIQDEGYIEHLLSDAKNDEERKKIKNEVEESKRKIYGNIEKVLNVVANLIEKLNQINNLPELLISEDLTSIGGNLEYFRDFKVDRGNGYIGNNFGQDLRNFKRFLEFAITKGAMTIWFTNG